METERLGLKSLSKEKRKERHSRGYEAGREFAIDGEYRHVEFLSELDLEDMNPDKIVESVTDWPFDFAELVDIEDARDYHFIRGFVRGVKDGFRDA
jgi:hypothetical protein